MSSKTTTVEKIQSVYTVGQSPSVHRLLSARTAENSAGFLIPYIKPNHKILDLGCGPGTITCDFANLVPEGSVVGFDASKDALFRAKEFAKERGVKNVEWVLGDGGKLPFEDNTFDNAYSHQVLIHAPNPVELMREIHRVLKPGGVYGTREADLTDTQSIPPHPAIPASITTVLQNCYLKYAELLTLNGSNPRAGKLNHIWAKEAGFDEAKMKRGEGWIDTILDTRERWELKEENKIPLEMVGRGVVSRGEMEKIGVVWGEYEDAAEKVGSKFYANCGEVICVK